MLNKVQGFIISIVPYKDYDAIINLFNEKQRISFKARSILKPTSKNASACQLYDFGEFVISSKVEDGKGTLVSAENLKRPKNLLENPKFAIYLNLLAEIIMKTDVNKLHIYYQMFHDAIDLFNQGNNEYLLMTLVTLTTLMEQEGIGLVADSCVKCGTITNINSVSYKNGGFLCNKCSEKEKEAIYPLNYLQSFRLTNLAKMKNITTFNVENKIGSWLLDDYINYLESAGGLSFRSTKLIKNIFK